MKILIFEYITGGGLSGQSLPASLRREGGLMLQTLAQELSGLADVQLVITLDARCTDLNLPSHADIVMITAEQEVMACLPALIQQVDAVWPIAPETDGILTNIAGLVRQQNKIVLLSQHDALVACTDKWQTYQIFTQHNIATVPTQLFALTALLGNQVIKPRDGCGCQQSIVIDQEMPELFLPAEQFILQPYIKAVSASLSALFKHGQAWLVCCNEQQIEINQQSFSLKACVVNTANPHSDYYQAVLDQLALAMPGLWGYIGIDVLEPDNGQPLLLEINPRLSSSYIGIGQATGINVAEQVLALLHGEPNLTKTRNQEVRVEV